MTKPQRLRQAMLVRLSEFGAAHAERFPEGTAGHAALRTVNGAIAEIAEASKVRLSMRDSGFGEKAAARAALRARIAAIVRTARAIAREEPGTDGRFQPPAQLADVMVLASARGFLQNLEVDVVKARFVRHGMPDTLADDLRDATDRFAHAKNDRVSDQMSLWRAQGSLLHSVRRGMRAARLLDVVVANTFGPGSPECESWRQVRRVRPGELETENSKLETRGSRPDTQN